MLKLLSVILPIHIFIFIGCDCWKWPTNQNINKTSVSQLKEYLNLGRSSIDSATLPSLASIVDKVICLPSPQVTEKSLAGTWQVLETVGKPKWQLYSEKLSVLKRNNRNFQIFGGEKSARRFVNLSEYYGPAFFATAIGTYSFIPEEKGLSKAKASAKKDIYNSKSNSNSNSNNNSNRNNLKKVKATVTGVQLHFFGKVLKLGVQGEGFVNVLFTDGDIRILENEDGARAIQQKVETPLDYVDLLKESSGLW